MSSVALVLAVVVLLAVVLVGRPAGGAAVELSLLVGDALVDGLEAAQRAAQLGEVLLVDATLGGGARDHLAQVRQRLPALALEQGEVELDAPGARFLHDDLACRIELLPGALQQGAELPAQVTGISLGHSASIRPRPGGGRRRPAARRRRGRRWPRSGGRRAARRSRSTGAPSDGCRPA